jgi:death-on-curing protein
VTHPPVFSWVTYAEARRAHSLGSGLVGDSVRDRGLIESALARPRNLHAYEGAGLAECAAAYAFGVAKNHGFLDGNKRAGLAVALFFIGSNGGDFTATDKEAADAMVRAAEGSWDEEALAVWFRGHVRER